eukprot:Tbor_TRINITY_DN9143_c0_g1::TRINITY_DN9143_c0_g1_i1::g.14447::m.14447
MSFSSRAVILTNLAVKYSKISKEIHSIATRLHTKGILKTDNALKNSDNNTLIGDEGSSLWTARTDKLHFLKGKQESILYRKVPMALSRVERLLKNKGSRQIRKKSNKRSMNNEIIDPFHMVEYNPSDVSSPECLSLPSMVDTSLQTSSRSISQSEAPAPFHKRASLAQITNFLVSLTRFEVWRQEYIENRISELRRIYQHLSQEIKKRKIKTVRRLGNSARHQVDDSSEIVKDLERQSTKLQEKADIIENSIISRPYMSAHMWMKVIQMPVIKLTELKPSPESSSLRVVYTATLAKMVFVFTKLDNGIYNIAGSDRLTTPNTVEKGRINAESPRFVASPNRFAQHTERARWMPKASKEASELSLLSLLRISSVLRSFVGDDGSLQSVHTFHHCNILLLAIKDTCRAVDLTLIVSATLQQNINKWAVEIQKLEDFLCGLEESESSELQKEHSILKEKHTKASLTLSVLHKAIQELEYRIINVSRALSSAIALVVCRPERLRSVTGTMGSLSPNAIPSPSQSIRTLSTLYELKMLMTRHIHMSTEISLVEGLLRNAFPQTKTNTQLQFLKKGAQDNLTAFITKKKFRKINQEREKIKKVSEYKSIREEATLVKRRIHAAVKAARVQRINRTTAENLALHTSDNDLMNTFLCLCQLSVVENYRELKQQLDFTLEQCCEAIAIKISIETDSQLGSVLSLSKMLITACGSSLFQTMIRAVRRKKIDHTATFISFLINQLKGRISLDLEKIIQGDTYINPAPLITIVALLSALSTLQEHLPHSSLRDDSIACLGLTTALLMDSDYYRKELIDLYASTDCEPELVTEIKEAVRSVGSVYPELLHDIEALNTKK